MRMLLLLLHDGSKDPWGRWRRQRDIIQAAAAAAANTTGLPPNTNGAGWNRPERNLTFLPVRPPRLIRYCNPVQGQDSQNLSTLKKG